MSSDNGSQLRLVGMLAGTGSGKCIFKYLKCADVFFLNKCPGLTKVRSSQKQSFLRPPLVMKLINDSGSCWTRVRTLQYNSFLYVTILASFVGWETYKRLPEEQAGSILTDYGSTQDSTQLRHDYNVRRLVLIPELSIVFIRQLDEK